MTCRHCLGARLLLLLLPGLEDPSLALACPYCVAALLLLLLLLLGFERLKRALACALNPSGAATWASSHA
jgi:hypothetical protein